MPRTGTRILPAASLLLFMGIGCNLIPLQLRTTGFGQPSEEQIRAAEAQRAEEEAAAAEREKTLVSDIEATRAEIAAGKELDQNAAKFAKLVLEAKRSKAAREGTLDMPKLESEAAGYLDKSIKESPSLNAFDLLISLPRNGEVDALVLDACPRVRPTVDAGDVPSFVGDCLDRAGGDTKKLKWPNVQKDISAYRKAEETRIAAEKKAEEEKRIAEQKAKEENSKMLRYAVAAVFASGRCHFGNCLKDGWTASSPEGNIEVRCNFGNCFKDGWVARFPDGKEARTRCSFSNCMKDGWETTYPDGKVARTRCSFSNCLKDGWETSLPDGGTARTRCSFQKCETDGWETSLPDGGRIQCRCNFQKCFENGATCN